MKTTNHPDMMRQWVIAFPYMDVFSEPVWGSFHFTGTEAEAQHKASQVAEAQGYPEHSGYYEECQ